jgi:hypothetical protein
MTHVKRIRPSKDNEGKLEVIVTTKSNNSTSFAGLHEVVGEDLEFGEVQVPHQMIYIKEVFNKYKDEWPLNFST